MQKVSQGFRKVILLVTLAVCMVQITHARESATVNGHVVSTNGEAVEYVVVHIKEQERHFALTDSDGHYVIKDLPYGEYTISASFVGYQSAERSIKVDRPHISHIKIEIAPLSTGIDEVVVETKSVARSYQERGFALSNVNTQATILSTVDTDELLNRAAGVKIRQSGGAGSDMEYSINGLSGNSVRVYINGVPISNYGPNFTVSTIPPALIERIDVFKGVVPAYLADDALGGAINVILKEDSINTLNTSYSYGSYNTHKVDVNGQWRNTKSGLTAGGSAYYNSSDNNYDVWGEAINVTDPATGWIEYIRAERFHDRYESYGVSGNVGFTHVNWADRFKVDMLYSGIDKDIQHGATMNLVYGKRRSEQQAYVSNVSYDKEEILPGLDLKSHISYSYTDRQVIDTCNLIYDWTGEPTRDVNGNIKYRAEGQAEGGDKTLERNLEQNITARLNLNYALDKEKNHIISVNGMFTDFQRDVDDACLSTAEQSLMDTRYITKLTASASYDTKLFKERLRGSIFYKLFKQSATLVDPVYSSELAAYIGEEYSNSSTNSGYGTALSYAILPNLFITFSAEKAIRLPSFTELLGDASNNVEATIDLDPEKSTNINVGTIIGPFVMGRNHISVKPNFFYRNVTNLIERSIVDATDDTYGYENIGKVLSKGADIEVDYSYKAPKGELTIAGAASYSDARFNVQYNSTTGVENLHYGDRLRNQPYLTANGEVNYRMNSLFGWKKGRITFNYFLNYTHEFNVGWDSFGGANKARVPTQLTHDIGVVYTLPSDKYSVSFDAKNIFDEQLFDNYALQKPGRWLSCKFSYKIF